MGWRVCGERTVVATAHPVGVPSWLGGSWCRRLQAAPDATAAWLRVRLRGQRGAHHPSWGAGWGGEAYPPTLPQPERGPAPVAAAVLFLCQCLRGRVEEWGWGMEVPLAAGVARAVPTEAGRAVGELRGVGTAARRTIPAHIRCAHQPHCHQTQGHSRGGQDGPPWPVGRLLRTDIGAGRGQKCERRGGEPPYRTWFYPGRNYACRGAVALLATSSLLSSLVLVRVFTKIL